MSESGKKLTTASDASAGLANVIIATAGSGSGPAQPLPPLPAQAANIFQSVVAFVGDGCGTVDDAAYAQRLAICRACDRLRGDRCAVCVCFIRLKARGRVFSCPIGPW